MIMKRIFTLIACCCLSFSAFAQKAGNFNGLEMGMGNIFRLSDAETRSISPENFTGEKGKGGMAMLEEGVHGHRPANWGGGGS